MYILANISGSEGNQAIKIGQSKEHNMRNISLVWGGETIFRPFSKKSKLNVSLDQYSKDLNILFILYAKLKTTKMYWNEAADHLLWSHVKLF